MSESPAPPGRAPGTPEDGTPGKDGGAERCDGLRELRIEALAAGGDGVARPGDGPVVFIPGTAPGDRVLADVGPLRKGVRRGRLIRVLDPGPRRRPPPCPEGGHDERSCGGCPWQHLDLAAQADAARRQVVDALVRLGRLGRVEDAEALVEPAWRPSRGFGLRRRARFHATMEGNRLRLGFHAPRSVRVHAFEQCPALEPALEALRRRLEATLADLVEPGTLVGASVAVDVPAGHGPAAVELRLERPPRDVAGGAGAAGIARGLLAADEAIAACTVRLHRRRRPLGSAGERFVAYRHGPPGEPERWAALHAPGAFLQASVEGNAALVATVLAFAGRPVGEGEALELHAGAGNLTLALAEAGWRVRSIEADRRGVDAARLALSRSGLEADVRCGDAAVEALRWASERSAAGRPAELVVLDPPRRGAREEIERLLAAPAGLPERLVHVSCDPATLARDLARLVASGMTLTRVRPLLLFPQTPHVEAVALLER